VKLEKMLECGEKNIQQYMAAESESAEGEPSINMAVAIPGSSSHVDHDFHQHSGQGEHSRRQ
jgi:hypothetical protein